MKYNFILIVCKINLHSVDNWKFYREKLYLRNKNFSKCVILSLFLSLLKSKLTSSVINDREA